ncbi:hypothetical protein M527_22380 [Sphingobium indicum IP26]|nr:hypothetical protein M527_22380 [Sphingobium indicum IP26]
MVSMSVFQQWKRYQRFNLAESRTAEWPHRQMVNRFTLRLA